MTPRERRRSSLHQAKNGLDSNPAAQSGEPKPTPKSTKGDSKGNLPHFMDEANDDTKSFKKEALGVAPVDPPSLPPPVSQARLPIGSLVIRGFARFAQFANFKIS